jgi:hypothetical protein
LTANLIEAVLDRKKLKWDAFWHLFAWLLRENEGHGLGTAVMEGICQYAFGERFPKPDIHLECQLSDITDGKGMWVDLIVAIPSGFKDATHVIVMDDLDLRSPGSKRKLDNLTKYWHLTGIHYPSARVCVVVMTNALNGDAMLKAKTALDIEVTKHKEQDGWKLLSISTVGSWVETCLDKSPESDPKMRMFLKDFVEWSRSLLHLNQAWCLISRSEI